MICTKDRYDNFVTCFKSIQKQEVHPYEVIVVDASTDHLTEIYAKNHGVIYIKQKKGGLSNARNLSIKKVSGEIVLFLDEDVILDKSYIKNILKTYNIASKSIIGGVEGFVENQKSEHFVSKILDYLFLLDSPIKKGVVLPSGHNTYPNKLKFNDIYRVYWLSGCNMSYRKVLFDKYKFDERFGAVSGKYCSVGEDLDFSYRVSKKYVLLINQRAKLKHLFLRSKEPVTVNLDSIRKEQVSVMDRYTFFKKNMNSSIIFFWWSELGHFISTLFKYFLKLRKKK